MPRSSTKFLFLVSALFVVIAVVVGIIVDSERRRKDAENLCTTAKSFVVGATTLATVKRDLERFNRYSNGGVGCSATGCGSYDITNRWLKSFHLAPGNGFGVSLWFNNGILQRKAIYMGAGPCCVVYVTDTDSPPNARIWPPKIDRDRTGVALKALIHITPQSTNQERAVLDSFNFRCLTKIGGCPTAEEMAPGVSKIVSGSQ